MADETNTNDQTVGASRGLETVEIVNPYNPSKIIRINASDFDPKIHVKLRTGGKPRTEQEVALLQQFQATYESVQAAKPASEKDDRDLEIERLRAELAGLKTPKKAEEETEEEKATSKKEKAEKPAEVKHVGKVKHAKTEPTDSLSGLDEI